MTSKKLYSTYFKEYIISEESIEELHNALLGMFIDIKDYCDKYNIDYMVGGGTLLGAIRHKGFIPWDDDIDIMMTRENYEKFVLGFNECLGEKYLLAEPLDELYFFKMPKVYKKNTTYVEIADVGLNSYNMLFIDLFILENVPAPGIKRNIRSKIYDLAYKGASACKDYLYPSPIIDAKANEIQEVAHFYNMRKKIGKLFSTLGGIEFYLKLCEKLEKYKKITGWIGCPAGISYEKEIFPKEVYQEIDEAEFCGMKVKIPRYYDVYLKNLYGNAYMKIPPLEKREYHVAYKVKI